jgi:hypothetical protein
MKVLTTRPIVRGTRILLAAVTVALAAAGSAAQAETGPTCLKLHEPVRHFQPVLPVTIEASDLCPAMPQITPMPGNPGT